MNGSRHRHRCASGSSSARRARTGTQVLDDFLEAEELGFDHAWLVDHLVDTDGGPEDGCLEAWTLLAAIAAKTKRIRLGVLVSSNTFRNPAILLKEAVTVDHISGGRLILGIGTGWHEDEHRRYGIDLPAAAGAGRPVRGGRRADQPADGAGADDLQGRYYRLDDARLEPRPVQRPRIPILIAAHRPRMLRIAARYADQWDTFARDPRRRDGGRRSRSSPIASPRSTTPAGRSVATRPRSAGRPGRPARRCARPTPISTSSAATIGSASRTSRRSGPRPSDVGVLRRVAAEIIPSLRAGRLLQ